MKEICRVYQIKDAKGKYAETFRETDEAAVYRELANDLIAKKLNGCSYITRIKRNPNYDGTQNITITYSNDCRNIYTVRG